MTTIYKQRGQYDCFLACVGMVVDKPPQEIFPPLIYAALERDGGCARSVGTETESLLAYAGLNKGKDYTQAYIGSANPKGNVLGLLKGRRAMLQVTSLNNAPPAQHYVYWDGYSLHDPSNKQTYGWLEQCSSADTVFLFNEKKKEEAETDVQAAVGWTVIEVEKQLCAKLGRSWTPAGMSVESLIEELANRSDDLTPERLQHIAQRFLNWKLPPTFSPDAGIKYTPSNGMTREEAYAKSGWWPIGTNLFNSEEAKELFAHALRKSDD